MNAEWSVQELRPLIGADDQPVESEPEYLARVGPLLPNVPPDVLGQRFYDHWRQIDEWRWLDLPRLRFELAEWSTSFFRENDLGDAEGVAGRVNYFRTTDDLALRFRRLLEYIEARGTWPRPVVVLDTRSPFPWLPGWMERDAFQLLEGHHRLAALRALADTPAMQEQHKVWVVTYMPTP